MDLRVTGLHFDQVLEQASALGTDAFQPWPQPERTGKRYRWPQAGSVGESRFSIVQESIFRQTRPKPKRIQIIGLDLLGSNPI